LRDASAAWRIAVTLTDEHVNGIRVLTAQTPEHWATARELLEQYEASLDFALDFQSFDRELASLASEYAPPDGTFLLAEATGVIVGCVGLRRFSPHACEMKRLFTLPAARGLGAGRLLAVAVIAAARERGYRRMLLDTVPAMIAAQRLYRKLGFVATGPYRYNPVVGAVFMERPL
jgi:GNAT superfamily N-acetyltransferase